MRGIVLKDVIKQFGFKVGFNLWFRWNILDPTKLFYWKYIIAKPLCTYCGYFLCKPDCQHKKIIGRKNIIEYEKARHKEIEKQAKTIRGSEDGICAYCSEEKGTEIIDDPNWDTIERWLVCKSCKEVLKLSREVTMPFISQERALEINDRLKQISDEIGKPIMMAEIAKDNQGKYHISSITFTGEEDEKNN